jgi:hypothetical protein
VFLGLPRDKRLIATYLQVISARAAGSEMMQPSEGQERPKRDRTVSRHGFRRIFGQFNFSASEGCAMGIHAISFPRVTPRRESSIYPLCLTIVALTAISPMYSMLARPALPLASQPTVKSAAGPVRHTYTDRQFAGGESECPAPDTDVSE